MSIIKNVSNPLFTGCDFVVQLPSKKATVLQLTDTQIIDALQRRTPDRLGADEVAAWTPDAFDALCGNHIRSLVTQASPDLIIITGDIVYGEFDDAGTTFRYMCDLMDSFKIPWAPVFGNHDNESARGVVWQCEQFENCTYCLFKRGTVTGNSNYTVGLACGDELFRVFHMIDSNGCWGATDPEVNRAGGIFPDQWQLVKENTAAIRAAQNRNVPAFAAFHIPVMPFRDAEFAKGYRVGEDDLYALGVDTPAQNGDFGFCLEKYRALGNDDSFIGLFKGVNIDGVFVGHVHNANTCISYEGIKWVFGMKTGQYDYHVAYQLGGTLIRLDDAEFTVNHLPSLAPCGAMPAAAPFLSKLTIKG